MAKGKKINYALQIENDGFFHKAISFVTIYSIIGTQCSLT